MERLIFYFISRHEALGLAQQILINAEQERLAIAEFEAARGIQWEKSQFSSLSGEKSLYCEEQKKEFPTV